MRKINLLVAPNSFKECADAIEIAASIKKHFTEPEFRVKSIPISDGGDGFLKTCESNFQLETFIREVPSFCDENIF